MRSPLAFALCWLTLAVPALAGPLAMTVSPAGDVTLALDGHPVATGRWTLRQDCNIPAAGPAPAKPGPVVSVTATQDGPAHAVVHERHAAVAVDYAYDLAGEDLTIAAHVVNLTPDHALNPLAFTGLTFHFNPAVPVTGQLAAWHWTYLVAQGLNLFHPSTMSPVGCWWAADDHFGFAAHSDSEFDAPALVAAVYANHDGSVPAECQPEFYTARGLPPGGSADVTLTLRVTADRSLPHLLGGYKAAYDRRFPVPLYTPDRRPVSMFSEVDQNHVTPADPLGYHADWCRFDTAWGAAAYVRRFAPDLKWKGFAGTIFWSPGGYDPPMYPPDFDVLPPAVLANLPALVKGYHDLGLRVGICTRPGDGVNRPKGAEPTVYRLSADDPTQMRVDLDRFRHAMAMGFDMFYLDSIGGDGVNDARIIRQIRAAVGPRVALYSEYCTDLSLPYAGRYCEWTGNGIKWNGGQTYAALRLLRPDATWLCVSKTRQVVPPADAELGLVPLVGDQAVVLAPKWPRLPPPSPAARP